MLVSKKIIAVLNLIFICNLAYAGYEQTKWGMNLKKIQKLYPGGYMEKQQNGEVMYSLVRPVSGLPTGYTIFSFDSKKGLRGVHILFPQQGSTVNFKTGTFTEMSLECTENIFKSLLEKLKLKYGEPLVSSHESKEFAWATKDGDMVMLTILPSQVDSKRATASISYSKIKGKEALVEGL